MSARLHTYFQQDLIEAGCDEAGRGCLAGSVFAAAVILPVDFFHPDLNDSKQINEAKRDKLRPIIEKEAIAWSVASVNPAEIDTINILNASILQLCDHLQPELGALRLRNPQAQHFLLTG